MIPDSHRAYLAEKLWTDIAKPNDGCWVPSGVQRYGRVKSPDGKMLYAHRVVYELTYGPIPNGLKVCHTCDNPPCRRPDHLFLGTDKDNSLDMMSKGRHFLHGAEKCRTGRHYRTPSNLYMNSRGTLLCKDCMADRQRRYRARNKVSAAGAAGSTGCTPSPQARARATPSSKDTPGT